MANTGDLTMKDESSNSANTSSCFYGLCIRQPCSTACGKYSCGLFKYNYKFKNPVHRTVFCLMILIVVCLLFAVIVPMVLYSITDTVINYEVVIDSESAPNYDLWHTNAYGTGKEHAKIQMDLYFFDLQNPEEVAYNRSKPRLVERGPYAYDEYYLRFDIEWTDHGDTVSYYLQKYYIFNQERTGPGLQENDMILMPYPTVVGFKYILDEIPPEVNEYFDQSIEANLTAIERNLIGDLNNLYDEIIASEGRLPTPVRDDLVNELRITNQSVVALFDYLDSFLDQSSVPLVLFKTLMCNVPSGLSPFWRATPSMAWFGWLRDPILYEVQKLIDVVTSFNRTANATIPWTSSVPGPTVNWTSTAEVRRRKSKDTFKTGKFNPKQVGLYVNYQNMSTVWTCIKPARSIDQEPYIEGEEFPACDHFQRDWTVAQAREHGYAQPFDGDYANRVQGSDCTLFGRPVTSPKAAVFISDVFRSAYAQQVSIESWYGIPVHRFGIQYKDMLNASVNPENAQYYSLGPSGLLNLTKADNLPVFVSFPHFYMADSRLVEAVEGLSPRKEIHETVVDVEPNTGALVRAKKRLQVNYQIDSYSFPEISQEAEAFGYGICENITHIVQQLVRFGVLDPATVPDYQCDTILLTPFFKCLAINGNWSVQNDRIFHPYGWVNEAAELPESDATDWKNSLFLVYDIADKVRLWSLVAAGLLFGALVAALYSLRRGGQSVEYEAVKGDCVEGGAVVQPLIPHDILDKTCV